MTTRAVRPLLAGLLAACALFALAATGYGATKARKPGPPTVTTGTTHAQGVSVTLFGTVNPRGAATTYFFQYGPTLAYGKQTTPATLPAGVTNVRVGQPAPGMLPGYHYRLVASSALGVGRPGRDRTFVTSKSRRAKFSIAKPQEATVYGGSTTITGSLIGAGNAGRRLQLQASPYPYLTSFVPVLAPATTNAAGAFSFRVTHLLKSTQYRVATLDARPQYSKTITVQAAYRVTLRVKTSSRKGLVRLYGTVTPAVVGARVQFQLNKKVRPGNTEKTEERTTRFATQFATTTKRGTKTLSRFSAIVKVRNGGSYRAHVEPVKAGPYASGNSSTVLLHSASK